MTGRQSVSLRGRTRCGASHSGRVFIYVLIACASGFVGSGVVASEFPVMRKVTDPLSAQVLAPFANDFATPADLGLKAEEVQFENGFGNRLRGWYFPVEGAEHSILICMGNTGNIACMLQYAEIFVSGGFNVLMFDYQGYGGSEGSASVLSLASDATAAFDWLVNERGQPPRKIGIFGVSLGSILAMSVAASRGAGAVATEDIFLPGKHVDAFERFYEDQPLIVFAVRGIRSTILPQVDPIETVKRLQCPLFLVHGERDRLLPPSGSVELAEVAEVPTRVWIMDGVGHAPESLEVNDLEFRFQLCRFFADVFSGRMTSSGPEKEVRRHGDRFRVRLHVTADQVNQPIQVCASNGGSRFSFHRLIPDSADPVEIELPFPPSHVSSLVVEHTTRVGQNSWKPRLSSLSRDRQRFMELQRDFASNARVFIRDPDRNRIVGWYFDAATWQEYQARIPEPTDVHPRVRPRYARWLAMLEVYMRSDDGVQGLSAAEMSLAFLPAEPENYFQLDNAGFELGLIDPFVARSLTWLARQRLEERRFDESQELLRMYLRVKPPTTEPILSEAHINAIDESTAPDLLPEIPQRIVRAEWQTRSN